MGSLSLGFPFGDRRSRAIPPNGAVRLHLNRLTSDRHVRDKHVTC